MPRQAKYGPYNYERILGGRDYHLTADVDAFVKETILRLRALPLQATQYLIDNVQTPTGKGGKMRVDTGFLRASGQTSLIGMPTGPVRGEKSKEYIWKEVDAIVDLAGFEIGQTIYFGWTANYAKFREAYDGFLISGVQRWQEFVDRACEDIKARSPASKR